jgi:hypothetical protein
LNATWNKPAAAAIDAALIESVQQKMDIQAF